MVSGSLLDRGLHVQWVVSSQGVHVREGEGAGISWKEYTEAIMSDG